MPVSDRQWQVAQSWIGTTEPRVTFDGRFEALGDSLDGAILESLRSQLGELNGQPSSFSLPSGLSVSISENLRSFRQQMKDFENAGGTEASFDDLGFGSYRRVRPDLR